jgi:hypothetical protein
MRRLQAASPLRHRAQRLLGHSAPVAPVRYDPHRALAGHTRQHNIQQRQNPLQDARTAGRCHIADPAGQQMLLFSWRHSVPPTAAHARAVRQLQTTDVDQRRICPLDALPGGLRHINLQLITLASDILLQLELSSDIYRALPCPPST